MKQFIVHCTNSNFFTVVVTGTRGHDVYKTNAPILFKQPVNLHVFCVFICNIDGNIMGEKKNCLLGDYFALQCPACTLNRFKYILSQNFITKLLKNNVL